MEPQISSNTRVAKNAVMLAVRMLLILFVGLYTTRIVLNTLGVVDYGIYGVVGGIVAAVSFLNTSMSNAISRFLIFCLGKGDYHTLRKTFASALFTQIILALIVLLVSETVGLWFLYNVLNIPIGRMDAAFWTFQASIACMIITFIQTPFNASIIAHERMGVYAYIEILNSLLKLGSVYILLVVKVDKLILYAFLIVAVHIITLLAYYLFCRLNFEECKLRLCSEKKYIKPLLSFSAWNVFRNMSVTARQQGNNFLINIFFGVVLNSASGLATTIYGLIMGLANSISTAFNPKIVKLYAKDRAEDMNESIYTAVRYSTLIMGVITLPAILEMKNLTQLWLGRSDIDFVIAFCSIQLLVGFINLVTNTVVSGVMATGKIRKFSIVYGGLYLMSLPVAYIVLKLGVGPLSTYWVTLGMGFIILLATSFVLKQLVPQFSVNRIVTTLALNLLIVVLCGVPAILLHFTLGETLLRAILVGTAHLITLGGFVYLFLLPKELKQNLKRGILRR